ncbi:hypothetical protein AA0229_0709 [Gluconobacter cerinus NRIC 0229]|nr:hypothetical protein AA0229_0709 [Gluconobacter cerinus NRIC 0229]
MLEHGRDLRGGVSAFHALEDEVGTSLKRQMQMWHQAGLVFQKPPKVPISRFRIKNDRVDGRQAQAFDGGNVLQERPAHPAQTLAVCALPRSNINTRENDFTMSGFSQGASSRNSFRCGGGAGVSPAIGDDAERAAMIASLLDLKKSTGMP